MTVSAPTENFKENLEVLRVEREPNGCCRANSNVIALVGVHGLGRESLSQAVKEGGLASIRDNEAEGECRHISVQFGNFLPVSPCVSCQLLSVRSPSACALC